MLPGRFDGVRQRYPEVRPMHYPRRVSRIKKKRNQGFRARMSTSKGRRLLSRKRRHGFKKLTNV
jgi:ribosomal protein L34